MLSPAEPTAGSQYRVPIAYVYRSQPSVADAGTSDSNQTGPRQYHTCENLVIVCGHATWTGERCEADEDKWILQDFQRSNKGTGKPGEHRTFVAHIMAGVLAAKESNAMLIFSGGRTSHSERTEANSYQTLCAELGIADAVPTACEDHAADSYQNLLFSLLKFRKLTGRYPESIIVVTHAFKARRFHDLHRRFIKWSDSKFRVQGINPPMSSVELSVANAGEDVHGYGAFCADPYGARSPLADKRLARNYVKAETEKEYCTLVDPNVRLLFHWTGGESGKDVFPLLLPWEP